MTTLADLDKEYAEKRTKLILENRLRDSLVVTTDNMRIHTYSLYGCDASITYEKCTVDEAARILINLPPPIPTVKVSGTFTSFMTEEYANTLPDDKVTDQLTIFPMLLKIEPASFKRAVKLSYFSRLADHVVEFVFEFGLHSFPGVRVDIRTKNHPGYTTVEKCELVLGDKIKHIQDGGTYMNPIRWASGGKEYPNDFTIYYTRDNEPDGVAERQAVVNWLMGLATPEAMQ